MFAAGYDWLGPIRFSPNSVLWKPFFEGIHSDRYRIPSKGNMINVDFIAGTAVVDKCINATRMRANRARQSRPVGLTVGRTTTDSIFLEWQRPFDSEQLNAYVLCKDGQYVATKSNSTQFTFDGLKDGTNYRLGVYALFNSGYGATAEIVGRTVGIPDITKPTPPTNFRLDMIGEVGAGLLSWDAATDNIGVTGYQVYCDGVPSGGLLQQTFKSIYLTSGASYKIRAFDAAGNFADSESLVVPQDQLRPSKPTNVRPTSITGDSVSLEWDPSSDNIGVTGYRIYRENTPHDTVTIPFFIDRNLNDVTAYTYSVTALDGANNESYRSESLTVTTLDITPPSKPKNLKIYTQGEVSALICDSSTDNVKVIKYECYRNGVLVSFSEAPTFIVHVTEPYWFKIRALDAAGNYTDSDLLASVDLQPPSKPGGLRARYITDYSVTLEWRASTDNVAVIGYQVLRNNIPLTTVEDTLYTVTGLEPGSNHVFMVRALDPAGNFTDSAELPVTTTIPDITPPSKPTNLRATTVTHTSVTLQWDASSDNVGVLEYEVYIDGWWFTYVRGTTLTVEGMTEGATYFFKVRALDAAGNGTDSDTLPVTTTKPDTTAPSKPENLIARYSTSSTARLQWDAASDNVGVVLYEIFVNGNFSHTAFGTIAIASGLAGSTEYLFSVRAIDAASNAGKFAHFVHHHLGSDLTPPSPPSNLRAFEITSNSARLSWSPSTDNVAVTGYEIWHLQERIDTVPDLQYLITNLNASTTYTLRVYAVDSAGYRSEPNRVEVTTLASNGPTNLTFERSSDIVGLLNWEPPVDSIGVTGYQLSRDRNILGDLPDTYYLFLNLTPGVTHLFEVRANRNGTYSDAVHIRG
ncbi:hypothetical protein F6476_32295 [Pseudomonas umsongensis]|nr:hypothetical protein F6476_32295 [Pseudomonas umsongensis]